MATDAHSLGAPTCAPSIPPTSRRSVLAGMLFAPVAALPAVVSACPPVTARVEWDRLIAAWQAAKLESTRYQEAVWRPAFNAVEKMAPRPDLVFHVPDRSGYSPDFILRPDRLDEWDDHSSPPFRRAAGAVKANWLSYQAARKRIGYDAIADEEERLGELEYEARWRAIKTPAPDLAALRWKLEQLFGPDARDDDDECPAWAPDIVNNLMADITRLLPGGLN